MVSMIKKTIRQIKKAKKKRTTTWKINIYRLFCLIVFLTWFLANLWQKLAKIWQKLTQT